MLIASIRPGLVPHAGFGHQDKLIPPVHYGSADLALGLAMAVALRGLDVIAARVQIAAQKFFGFRQWDLQQVKTAESQQGRHHTGFAEFSEFHRYTLPFYLIP